MYGIIAISKNIEKVGYHYFSVIISSLSAGEYSKKTLIFIKKSKEKTLLIKWLIKGCVFDHSTKTYILFNFLMSPSISANSFSRASFLRLPPVVSTNFTWVCFWYSRLTSYHLLFSPSLISATSLSERTCLNNPNFTFAHCFAHARSGSCGTLHRCYPLSSPNNPAPFQNLSSSANQPVPQHVWHSIGCFQWHCWR